MTETATRRRRKPAEAAPSTEAAAGTAGDGRPLDRSDNAPPEEASGYKRAADQLRSFVERIERLEEEKKTIADDVKDVYGEAKGVGYDTKIIREIVKLRKQDADERAEHDALLDTYKAALGMLPADYADE